LYINLRAPMKGLLYPQYLNHKCAPVWTIPRASTRLLAHMIPLHA